MLGDPGKAAMISLAFVLAALMWFAALWLADEEIFSSLGYAMHAITLLAIFTLLAATAVTGLFWRFAAVKSELLAGRRVIARWRVDRKAFSGFAPVARDLDRAEKRQALFLVWFFLLAIFGGFALYDRDAAPVLLGVGAATAAAMGLAFLAGQRISARHLEFRSGEVIVGERGLLFNDVLHVWSVPLSWLAGAELGPDGLAVAYAYFSRMGPQYVTVLLPAPEEAAEAAQRAQRGLAALARGA